MSTCSVMMVSLYFICDYALPDNNFNLFKLQPKELFADVEC